jgi:ATP-dependent DNA helicase RecQ
MNKSLEILNKYWGFNTFRPSQEPIIQDVIHGFDTLALLPTGGGKSICFQVPGLVREGLTLVISPLIALMQDQVQNLKNRGIRATCLTSGMSYREIDLVLDNARFGGLDFLYTSPERIQSNLFIERFKLMQLGLIVVDEAHCISEWGHDFRPSFLKIKILREYHSSCPLIALTATATEQVKEDIIRYLLLKNPKIHESSFERKNLIYSTYQTHNKLNTIIKYCLSHSDVTGIVYCQTRKSVKEIARSLLSSGIRAATFHGGMVHDERKNILNRWLSNDIRVIVATNAFGMGIDKADVRFVLHYEFPSSIEAYFQEAGRAGRDEKSAKAIALWNEVDIQQHRKNLEIQFPPLETIKHCYRALCSYLKIAIGSGKNENYPLNIRRFSSVYGIEPTTIYHSLKLLERNGTLAFSENFFNPTKVKFIVGNKELYNFQVSHQKYLPITTLLSRSYPGIFDLFIEIHETELCKRLKLNETALKQQFKELETYGIIDINWSTDLPTVTLLNERLPNDYITISHEVYTSRKWHAENKLNAAIDFLTGDTCRSVFLLHYFGQIGVPCGLCDNCKTHKENGTNFNLAKEELLSFLIHSKTLEECTDYLCLSSTFVRNLLKTLLLEERISVGPSGYCKI